MEEEAGFHLDHKTLEIQQNIVGSSEVKIFNPLQTLNTIQRCIIE